MKPENPSNYSAFSAKEFIMLIILLSSSAFWPGHCMAQRSDAENLNVFWEWLRWTDPSRTLAHHFINQADTFYLRRDREIDRLKTKDDWLSRQHIVKQKLNSLIGPFPQKTPLNPKITGVLQKDGYRVEKLVYESRPGMYVTGCLFIPDGLTGKAPAILNVIGHEQESFRAELDQIVYLNLIKKGMIVLAIDPIGQGEMVQYFDPQLGLSSIGYTVVEHFYLGNQCFLAGVPSARYFAWDGIRGIDYLISRPEVDPDRIGVTGFSGGGTVTSYISAVDERVKVSVPCSWSTSSRRQTETKGTQDAETVFIHGLKEGITFEDLVESRAPKPTLMTFVSRDQYLSVQGAREAYHEISKAYKVLGEPDNVAYVEDDYYHWLTPKIRHAIYAFFMKHFGLGGDPSEVDIELIPEKDLQVTPTGQVSTSWDAESVFSVNRKDTEKLIEKLESSRKNIGTHIGNVIEKATELSGFIAPVPGPGNPFFNGRYQRDGYSVAKYAIQGEGNYVIPLLLFVPDNPDREMPALVYLHPEGKAADAAPGGKIERLVMAGYIVAAADLPGTGELKDTLSRPAVADYTAVLIGRSTVGLRAGDIVRLVNYLRHLAFVDPQGVGTIGIREMAIPLIHAAAFDHSLDHTILVNPPVSYRSIAMNRFYRIGLIKRENGGTIHPYEVEFSWGVAGALTAYDLPDLIGCIAPRKVAISEPVNQLLEPADGKVVEKDMTFPRAAYSYRQAGSNLRIFPSADNLPVLVDWCYK